MNQHVMEANTHRAHAHANPGGGALVHKMTTGEDSDDQAPRHRGHVTRISHEDTEIDLVVRDIPGWDECWMELRRPCPKPAASNKERQRHG